jgi:hypothetical protein
MSAGLESPQVCVAAGETPAVMKVWPLPKGDLRFRPLSDGLKGRIFITAGVSPAEISGKLFAD